jgi:hypothetical protein
LNLCWMEYTGLHSKPKAEVHSEHQLTGPVGGGHSLFCPFDGVITDFDCIWNW